MAAAIHARLHDRDLCATACPLICLLCYLSFALPYRSEATLAEVSICSDCTDGFAALGGHRAGYRQFSRCRSIGELDRRAAYVWPVFDICVRRHWAGTGIADLE